MLRVQTNYKFYNTYIIKNTNTIGKLFLFNSINQLETIRDNNAYVLIGHNG